MWTSWKFWAVWVIVLGLIILLAFGFTTDPKKVTSPLIGRHAPDFQVNEQNGEQKFSLSEFTMFSFQAIKHITTGDGGMLCIKNKKLLDKARRIRWFGIDREGKQKGTWKNDIYEVGYKYQMTDIGASLGFESLKNFKKIINHRRKIYEIYLNELSKNNNIICVQDDDKRKKHAAWLFTILLEKKDF